MLTLQVIRGAYYLILFSLLCFYVSCFYTEINILKLKNSGKKLCSRGLNRNTSLVLYRGTKALLLVPAHIVSRCINGDPTTGTLAT